MAKSLTSILSQIERLQKEAASIQSEVIARIRKDIIKYGLTAEHLFGATVEPKLSRRKAGTTTAKVAKPPKYSDGAGNTWGGMGKRPEWLRQALAAGKALEDFLIGKGVAPAPSKVKASKAAAPAKRKVAAKSKPAAKKQAAAKSAAPRKARRKSADAQVVA